MFASCLTANPKAYLQHCKCGSVSYPSCLAETSICPHSSSTSFVKPWQPRATNSLPITNLLYQTIILLQIYLPVSPAVLEDIKRQQLFHNNI